MDFDPQKLFIGLMDFFSILMPGALVTYLLAGDLSPFALQAQYSSVKGTEAWIVFLFASYLFGHLIFLVGSWLDAFYDWVRRYTLNTQIVMLAHRDVLLPWLARVAIRWIFKSERNLAVDRAGQIRRQVLKPLQAGDAINTFQWCKAVLTAESSANLAVVQRFEADSKFFRSFVIVLILLLLAWPLQAQWPIAGVPIVILLLLLALWRYMEQRHKATNQAYWSVIALTARDAKLQIDAKKPSIPGVRECAGGVVYRMRRGTPQYLLVTAKDEPSRWVLPKGRIEGDEKHRETAVREVHEESGIWGRIVGDLGNMCYSADDSTVSVHFFLMKAVGRGIRKDPHRRRKWLSRKAARKQNLHRETRIALVQAERLRRTKSAGPA